LAGIGLGGAAYPLLFRRRVPTLHSLAWTCAVEAACIAVPYAMGDWLALWADRLRQASGGLAESMVGWTLVAGVVVFPAALVSGVQFPMLIAMLGRARRRVGREVGLVAAFNTLGAISGSLAGGFGLLPLLTAPGTWCAVVVLLALLSFGLVVIAIRESRRPRLWPLPLAAAAVALGCLSFSGPTAVWRHSAVGAGRAGMPSGSPNGLRNWVNARRRHVIWETEGVEASIALLADHGLSFCINGKVDGNAVRDVGTQVTLGLLGALVGADPTSALVVGLGTGESAGWLAEVPSIRRVDVVEIEPAIDEMARRCAVVNHNVLDHARVHRFYNDAREVILTSAHRYDLIVSEPSNPYRAGVASLFTREFYAACSERLTGAGLFVQWLQGYEVDAWTVATVFATLRSEFAHVEVWHSQRGDMLLLCANRPIGYAALALRERIEIEPFHSGFAAAWRVLDLEGLLSRYVAGTAAVDAWSDRYGGQLNTDDHNRIEYGFARTLGNRTTGFSIDHLREIALKTADHRPVGLKDRVNWDRVEEYRQLHHIVDTEDTRVPADAASNQVARAEVLRRYFAADARGMTATWEAAGYEPLFPTEAALLAIGYAHQGDEKATSLTEKLRSFNSAEADAIEAYLFWRQGRLTEATDRVEKALTALRGKPWILSHAGELLFDAAEGVAASDPKLAARLLAAMSRPLAVFAYEERRLE
ncbi:MAG: spermidine synthase, partial [Planctomycetes bacterium]|nr:spermidine synthase [Planctomycetota bacterium]